MSFRSAIGLCAIIVGVLSLALCQPPTPRIARVEVPPFQVVNNAEAKDILIASSQAERITQIGDLDDPFTNFSTRDR
ncbi:MAG: hypothetical protein CAF42_011475 [Nitrospira sp. CG24B]|nr:MAG: hypothetical protein CAF42_011475 [Nitrospira sp. CG24B]